MLHVRVASPEDYDRIVSVVDKWWGRPVSTGLPRLFLDHFWASSRVADDAEGLAGFLVAFVSPSQSELGYVHFVGVRPDQRSVGLARSLYIEFFDHARACGCREVRAVTAPANSASIRFHERLGFAVSEPAPDYNGSGRGMVVFQHQLNAACTRAQD
jgi:ribosomal protein S18 acetylase RimI-like enzyme